MDNVINKKTYSSPPIDKGEVIRYCGAKDIDGEFESLIDSCIKEAEGIFKYSVCYRILPLKISGDICDFGLIKFKSSNLAKNLSGCKEAVIFAATVGASIDRLIAKYGRISPSKALIFQAFGAERIESLCDEFCKDIKDSLCVKLKSRFSPGYGDLSLEYQKEVLSILDSSRQVGISLNDSLLMSPSKSVTAIAGIIDGGECESFNVKCKSCNLKNCNFRSNK